MTRHSSKNLSSPLTADSAHRAGTHLKKTTLSIGCLALLACGAAANADRLESHQDPSENAYTMELPAGWNNRLGIRRTNGEYQIPRQWATAESPDGQTRWFIGDPGIPIFQGKIPSQVLASTGLPAKQAHAEIAKFLSKTGIVVLPYQSAERFVAEYAKRRYGREPGFRILSTAPVPELEKAIRNQNQKMGASPTQVSTASLRFEFTGHTGLIWASTSPIPDDPNMWTADASGFTTNGDVTTATQLFNRAAVSLDVNLAWFNAEKQRAAQRVAAIQQRMSQQQQNSMAAHQSRMRAQQNSFNAHQSRMAANSAANDQRHQAWQQNQDRSYQQNQDFNRYIRDETLVNSGGNSYEVDAGYNNYYVDETNNEYFGTDQPLDAGQIPEGYNQAEESWGNW